MKRILVMLFLFNNTFSLYSFDNNTHHGPQQQLPGPLENRNSTSCCRKTHSCFGKAVPYLLTFTAGMMANLLINRLTTEPCKKCKLD
jgi:hypothetical protein